MYVSVHLKTHVRPPELYGNRLKQAGQSCRGTSVTHVINIEACKECTKQGMVCMRGKKEKHTQSTLLHYANNICAIKKSNAEKSVMRGKKSVRMH